MEGWTDLLVTVVAYALDYDALDRCLLPDFLPVEWLVLMACFRF